MKTATYTDRLAAKMLAGGGYAALTAFYDDPNRELDILDHHLGDDGELHVTCRARDVGPESTMARIDITRCAMDVASNIVIGSIHLIGLVRWDERDGTLRHGRLSLGEIYLHWTGGIEPLAVGDILAHGEPTLDEFEVLEDLLTWGGDRLESLHSEIVTGLARGEVLQRREAHTCVHQRGRTIVADVDERGIMLIGVGEHGIDVSFGEFDRPVATSKDFISAVEALVA